MSLNIVVYTESLSDDLIPKIINRLNDFEMVAEVYPGFSFNDHAGFLPFRFSLLNPHLDVLKSKELISGFELYVEDFDFKKTKQELNLKRSLLDKVLGKKHKEVSFVNPDIEKSLKGCKKVVAFVWNSVDSFELRFALLTSAVLTEIADGVCNYPENDIWYDNENIVEEAFKEIKSYELNLKEQDVKFHEFDKW